MTAGRFSILTARAISRCTSMLLWRGTRIPTIFGILSPVFRYRTRIRENNHQIAPHNHCKLQKKQDPWRSLSKTESNIIMICISHFKAHVGKYKKYNNSKLPCPKWNILTNSTRKKKLFFPNVESRNWNILFVRENSSSKAKKKRLSIQIRCQKNIVQFDFSATRLFFRENSRKPPTVVLVFTLTI